MFATVTRLGHRIGPVAQVVILTIVTVVILPVAAVLLQLVVISSTLSPVSTLIVLAAGLSLSGWQLISLKRWLERESWAGALLLNASDGPKIDGDRRLTAIIYFILSLGATACTIALWKETAKTQEARLLLMFPILFALIAISYLSSAFTHDKLEFRNMGILRETSFVPWSEIENWSWEPLATDDGFLVLLIQRRRPSARNRPMRIRVLPSKYENVARIMSSYLPWAAV
jgi:hypothetical protein